MKAPRYAHWLVAPTLALGIAVAPVHAQAAVAPARVEAEKGAKEQPGEAPKGGEAAPKGGSAAPTGGEAAPKGGSAAPTGGSAAPQGEAGGKAPSTGVPKGKASKLPKSATTAPPADGATPDAGAGTEPAAEGEPGATPEAGATPGTDAGAPAAEGEPTEGEPTEGEPAEAVPPEPEITVQPRAVEPSLETKPLSGSAAAREPVADARRLRSDERILFRAGLLAFGMAGAALVPAAVGLHQGAYARRVLDRLETPSEADARPEVQSYERTMNRMALVAGSVAVASVVTGALLVSLGARRGKPAPASVAPSVGQGTAGVVLRGRF